MERLTDKTTLNYLQAFSTNLNTEKIKPIYEKLFKIENILESNHIDSIDLLNHKLQMFSKMREEVEKIINGGKK